MDLIVVGSTGLVGLSFIEYLKNLNINFLRKIDLYFISSEKSKGKIIYENYKIITLEDYFQKKSKNFKIFINCANNTISRIIKNFLDDNYGIMIDNSSEFRMDKRFPLIVPHINFKSLKDQKIISNPNCSTIILSCLIKPLFDLKIKKINVSTYQAVSGAGKEGIEEYNNQIKQTHDNTIKKSNNNIFKYKCVGNCFVHDSEKTPIGYSKEELKMILETNKIFDSKIKINCTCVRVPVVRSHCLSVSIEFFEDQPSYLIDDLIGYDDNLILMKENEPDSLISSNQEKVFVGHIRKDYYDSNIYHFFISGDQILRGASYNAFKILENILEKRYQ